MTYDEPARSRHRPRYQAALTLALQEYAAFEKLNPTRLGHVRVRHYSKQAGYCITIGYRDSFSGGFVPVVTQFSG